MSSIAVAQPVTRGRSWLSNRALCGYWVLAGLALLTFLGRPAVQRTQEARVLETAREIISSDWRGWLIPHCDGQVRVRKPPLAYWMAAIGFKVGGVDESAGRVPTALFGLLTLGVTFACANWLFGRRPAVFAAGCLLGSYLFFRHDRLAETDAPAALFVTLAIFAFWRGAGEERGFTSALWLHLGAGATALAVLAKGPPGAYPLLFLLAWSVLRGRMDLLIRFISSGAVLTLIMIALPWFIYVLHEVGLAQWRREAHELLDGEDHSGHFYQYFVDFFKAVAPWDLLAPAGIIAAFQRWRDPRMAGLLVWLSVIFVPLCVMGNKQFHYLLPMMPPVMILTGWVIDQALEWPRLEGGRVPFALLVATVAVALLAVPAIIVVSRYLVGNVRPSDQALATAIAATILLAAMIWWRIGTEAAAAVFVGAVAAVLAVAVGAWMPSLEKTDTRTVADEVRGHFGAGPYCFYSNGSLALCFNLRTVIPQANTPQELEAIVRHEPRTVVIAQTKAKSVPPPIPPNLVSELTLLPPGQKIELYRVMMQ